MFQKSFSRFNVSETFWEQTEGSQTVSRKYQGKNFYNILEALEDNQDMLNISNFLKIFPSSIVWINVSELYKYFKSKYMYKSGFDSLHKHFEKAYENVKNHLWVILREII